jgi:hypothetical protein
MSHDIVTSSGRPHSDDLVATSPQLHGMGGYYFEDCNAARVLDPDAPTTTTSGVAAYALDLVVANPKK